MNKGKDMGRQERLTVWRCERCGGQIPSRTLAADLHVHGNNVIPAEEVEVIPAADYETFKEALTSLPVVVAARVAMEEQGASVSTEDALQALAAAVSAAEKENPDADR